MRGVALERVDLPEEGPYLGIAVVILKAVVEVEVGLVEFPSMDIKLCKHNHAFDVVIVSTYNKGFEFVYHLAWG